MPAGSIRGLFGPRISEYVKFLFNVVYTLIIIQLKHKNSAEVDIALAFGEITTACNVGQAKKGHGVCLKSGPASRVCQGQLLCKVSSSQLTLLQRNELYFLTRRKFSRLDAKF